MKLNKKIINQGDVFLCINKILGETYDNIADAITEITGTTVGINTPEINKMAHQKRKGFELLKDKSAELYGILFASHIDGKSREEQDSILFLIKDHILEKNNLTFDDALNDAKYDSCDKWIKHMLNCALLNWNDCRDLQKRVRKKKLHRPSLLNQNLIQAKFFIGREKIISKLKKYIDLHHITILRGIAGIGKSVIARQFAAKYKNDYAYIQEIISDMPQHSPDNTFEGDNIFHNLILKLGFEKSADSDEKISSNEIRLFMEKFEALKNVKEPVLLIFDSIDTFPSDVWLIDELLKYSNIHIIITTRLTRHFENFPSISVDPLSDELQLKLFEHYLGFEIDKSDRNNEDFRAVRNIFKMCDGNTMYIEHIAKYIKTWECSFTETLQSIEKGNPLLHYWTIQKDYRLYEDESFIGAFLHILFPIPISDLRKRVLKSLALIPLEGVSRKVFFEASDRTMQNELVSLENDGYVILEQSAGRNITRLHPIVRSIIRCEFFQDEIDCADFIEGLCSVMQKTSTTEKSRDIYGIVLNILDFMKLKEFEFEKVSEWLEIFRRYFLSKKHEQLEAYEIQNINIRINTKLNTLLKVC